MDEATRSGDFAETPGRPEPSESAKAPETPAASETEAPPEGAQALPDARPEPALESAPATALAPAVAGAWTPPPPFELPRGDFFHTPEEVAASAATASAMRTGEYWFRSSRTLAVATSALLGLSGLNALAEAIHFIVGVDLQGRLNHAVALQAEADDFNRVAILLSLSALALTVVTGLSFMRWLWRSVGNAGHLGAEFTFVTPRGSVTAWLVPIRNFWKPYQVVRRLHAALLSPLDSRSGRWLVRLWWIFWLAGGFVGESLFVVSRSLTPESSGNVRLTIHFLQALSAIVSIADAALAIAVVRQIQRLSDAREAARRGNPNFAVELVTASQRRRVTLLPFGLAAASMLVLLLPLTVMTAGAAGDRPWAEFTAPDGTFTVSAPGVPVEEQITTSPGGFSYHTGSEGTLLFTVMYFQFPAGSLDANRAATALDTMVAAMPGSPAGSVVQVDGHPAERASWSAGTVYGKAVFIFDAEASRLYVVEADYRASRADSPDIERFIGSFRLH